MAINVGADFKQRWSAAPETVRQIFLEDLNRICSLLQPQTDIQKWQDQEHNAQQMAKLRIDKAYAQLKAELIEQARIKKQNDLEQALAQKRAQEAAMAQQLLQDEQQQQHIQDLVLQQLNQHLQHQVSAQMQRYQRNPSTAVAQFPAQQGLAKRLEAEAEQLIEQAVTVFRAKLHRVAADYIAHEVASEQAKQPTENSN